MTTNTPSAKMTIEVYTVTPDGTATTPTTTVIVPHGYEPPPDIRGPQLAPCACPLHRHHPVTEPSPLPSSTAIMRAYASWLLDRTTLPRNATTHRFARDFPTYLTALIPPTEHLALSFPPDDIPATLALTTITTARGRLNEPPHPTEPTRELTRVQRLAHSVMALCDHYDTLTTPAIPHPYPRPTPHPPSDPHPTLSHTPTPPARSRRATLNARAGSGDQT
ncbi:DUF6415 family natural product biosynthesis protein [Streptomyces sp. NPDC093252]|uniref:DUF6415 family natural product biosynthesis protein n=1 Tax=Streptomyces sp. NPDC093252 TaxID=3154980 RepID=UPI00341847BC